MNSFQTIQTLPQLNILQKREMKCTRLLRFSPDMESAVVIGYSDFGKVHIRNARDMRRIRRCLSRFRLFFSCVPLLGVSDEAISLYEQAFCAGLSPAHAMNIVEGYRQRIRLIGSAAPHLLERTRRQRIIQAYTIGICDVMQRGETLCDRGV